MATGVTFKVADVVPDKHYNRKSSVEVVVNGGLVRRLGGKFLRSTQESPNTVQPFLSNGFVGAAFSAYCYHHILSLRPDDVWVAITTSLASYIDRNAEAMRKTFVDHEGKIELVAHEGGCINTANYDSLISQISDQIDKSTKEDIRNWVECNFSTTTPVTKIVSKVVLMGAMKNYFSYKFVLQCGLPAVRLEGTLDDWKEIRKRVDRLSTWNQKELAIWSEVLGYVMDHFVIAYQGDVDADFWNRIADRTGGGSGPSYLEGWILSFIPWTDDGKFILNPLSAIKENNSFGRMDTNDIPSSAVEVPVTIDDNGTEYKTILYAGALVSDFDEKINTLKPSLDWALIDITNAKPPKNPWD